MEITTIKNYEVYDETLGYPVSGKFYDREDAYCFLFDRYGVKEEDYFEDLAMQEIVYVREA